MCERARACVRDIYTGESGSGGWGEGVILFIVKRFTFPKGRRFKNLPLLLLQRPCYCQSLPVILQEVCTRSLLSACIMEIMVPGEDLPGHVR